MTSNKYKSLQNIFIFVVGGKQNEICYYHVIICNVGQFKGPYVSTLVETDVFAISGTEVELGQTSIYSEDQVLWDTSSPGTCAAWLF